MPQRAPALLLASVSLGLGAAIACAPPADPAASAPRASAEAVASCPQAGAPATVATVGAADVSEVSGIVASTKNADVFWMHNDSGDTARAFAVTRTGELRATLAFAAAKVVDVEDLAIEDVAPGESFLYFGDIGDNTGARTALTIHRVAEPALVGAPGQELTASSDTMQVVYEDGPHDAETLLFDPWTKDLLLATKSVFGGSSIHRVGPFASGATVTTERIARAPVTFATGGDISRDGRLIAIRSYGTTASIWTREPGESVAAALSRPPCSVPVATESLGEAFGFLAHGEGYATIAEGKRPELHVALFE